MALGVGDNPLEHPVQHEELLHLCVALAHEELALAVVGDVEQRLELVPVGSTHASEDRVLLELQADGVALRVIRDGGHCNGARVWTNRAF